MRYLVTGGSGFLGRALIRRLPKDTEIVAVARGTGLLTELQDLHRNVTIVPGDIADPYVVRRACEDVDGIYHVAAFKHVSLAEIHTRECVESNVIGTMNILEEARQVHPTFVLGVSTDKAAQVHGVYSATKLLQERLFLEYESLDPSTRYRTVRFGNILYSTGSVLAKWKSRIERGEEVVVTDLQATRFYWSVDQAVDLIFECLAKAPDAQPYAPKMKAIILGDLLAAMAQKYNHGKLPPIREIGLQPGESLHESMTGLDSSHHAEKYTMPEILALI